MTNLNLLLGSGWALIVVSSCIFGIYRTFIDRIRSGLSSSPASETKIPKLISKLLQLPNHERPFHTEAALLSALQVILGFCFLPKIDFSLFSYYWFVFLLVVCVERISSWLYPRRISQSSYLDLHLRVGLPLVLLFQLICKPLVWCLSSIEQILQSSSQKIIIEQEEESEVADHIRIVGREGANLDPNVLEIMGNTLEMSQLKIKDVMIPRNQVQILDSDDTFETNLEIAKSCGHTRLPFCDGDLDNCLGIIHVKNAFRSIRDLENSFDLKTITKPPVLLDNEDLLPVALKKMMRLKIHMSLVSDEFGGIVGVITLEDILEEVVGEIQDEFDSEEAEIEQLTKNEWKVSGLTPLHELPQELQIAEEADELTTLGGMITRDIGKIPLKGETFSFPFFDAEILDADETRVLNVKIKLKQGSKEKPLE